MRCIYCLEDKGRQPSKKVEHVIPQSFGSFKDNFTLSNDIVCNDCNKYFGDNLEINLARDTFEGMFLRYEHKVKEPNKFKSIGKRSKLSIKVADGPLRGAYAYQEYSKEDGKLVLKPLPQIGFKRISGPEYKYFLLDKIPPKNILEHEGFDLPSPKSIIILGCDKELAEIALRERDIPSKFDGEFNFTKDGEEALCKFESAISEQIFRAVAKIGFNYLAYWEGADFVMHSSFDSIRSYILKGTDYRLRSIEDRAILADERLAEKRRLGHIVTVNWAVDSASIVAQVSLLNYATYCICLSEYYSGDRRNIRRGHFFNIQDRTIMELGAI